MYHMVTSFLYSTDIVFRCYVISYLLVYIKILNFLTLIFSHIEFQGVKILWNEFEKIDAYSSLHNSSCEKFNASLFKFYSRAAVTPTHLKNTNACEVINFFAKGP